MILNGESPSYTTRIVGVCCLLLLPMCLGSCATQPAGETSSYNPEQKRREVQRRRAARRAAQRNSTANQPSKHPPVVLDQPEHAQVAPGMFAHCLLETNGRIRCWNDDFEDKKIPTHRRLVRVDSGARHFCGLTKRGHIECWGDNEFFQSTPPTEAGFVELASAKHHTCARQQDGSIHCWGLSHLKGSPDATGRSAYGRSAPETKRTGFPPSSAQGFVELTAGERHTCARKETGEVTCWGYDADARLDVPDDVDFVAIDALGATTCGAVTSGDIQCWGKRAETFESGDGATFSNVAVGGDYVCGLREDGRTTCEPSAGKKPDSVSARMYRAPRGADFVSVEASHDAACGVTDNNAVSCWPYTGAPTLAPFKDLSVIKNTVCAVNDKGRVHCMASGNTYGKATPPTEETFQQISVGRHHTCTLRKDGTIACWGLGERSEDETLWLLHGGRESGCYPTSYNSDCDQASPPDRADFSHVSADWDPRTCAVTKAGAIECWGQDIDENGPPPPSGTSYRTIELSDSVVCGLLTSGEIRCSGANAPPGSNFAEISLHNHLVCGLTTQGTIQCTGASGFEDLPDKSTTFKDLAVAKGGICGITDAGELRCWGVEDRYLKPLDSPNSTERYTHVALSNSGLCAIRQDGALRCSGAIPDATLEVRTNRDTTQ
jgi:alpha-tubulin suppressor-like RCC1 family protein